MKCQLIIVFLFREYARVTQLLKEKMEGDNIETHSINEDEDDSDDRDITIESEDNLTSFYIKQNINRTTSHLDKINEVCL